MALGYVLLVSLLTAIRLLLIFVFCLNQSATTESYTLSLHDALPISRTFHFEIVSWGRIPEPASNPPDAKYWRDRKSTRLNSSHSQISYAVFCVKKKTSR